MTVDQPLCALVKEIQWSKPNYFGEDCFLVMMGDLHSEMILLKYIGNNFVVYLLNLGLLLLML